MRRLLASMVTCFFGLSSCAALSMSSTIEADGRLVIFRPNGGAITVPCVLKIDGTDIAYVRNKRFVEIPVQAKKITLSAADSFGAKEIALDVIELSFEPGETKFVKCKRAGGLLPFGDFELSLSNETTFQNFKPRLKAQDQSELKR